MVDPDVPQPALPDLGETDPRPTPTVPERPPATADLADSLRERDGGLGATLAAEVPTVGAARQSEHLLTEFWKEYL